MKAIKKNNNNEINYWQPMADMLAALLLVVLLLLMLAILYIPRALDDTLTDSEEGDNYETEQVDDGGGDGRDWKGDYLSGDGVDNREGYGDGRGDGDGDGDDHHDTSGGGGSGDGVSQFEGIGTDKAAVYVMVVDAETDRTIKEEGITFELYSSKNALQILNTYYPEKVEYKKFVTTEDGVFYLPEKIPVGAYFLHEMTAPKGYEIAENQFMEIHDQYDWPNPYILKVPLYPLRNIVKLQVNDSETGVGVAGGVYDVVAKTDIVTSDGTIRYSAGDVAASITIDENGVGESAPLYIGEYALRQSRTPEYYAKDMALPVIDFGKSGKAGAVEAKVASEKTRYAVVLVDELNEGCLIDGAEFELSGVTEPKKLLRTDYNGRLEISDLKKNRNYALRQISSPNGYRFSGENISFSVSSDGLIDGAASGSVTLTNRMIRVQVGLKDALIKSQVSDYNIAVFDSDGELVNSWNSTGISKELEGLEPGNYMIRINGNADKQKLITVNDVSEIQRFTYTVWSTEGLICLAALIGAGVAVIAGTVYIVIKKRRDGGERSGGNVGRRRRADRNGTQKDDSDNGGEEA